MTELEYADFLKSETDLKREADLICLERGLPLISDSLEHHGIKGMKWGIRRTPEQLGYKTGTKKKKAQNIFEKAAEKRKKKAAAARKEKERRKAEETEEKAKMTAKEKEKLREELLKSTDPKFLYKHRDLLSANELQDRISRMQKENDLKKMAEGSKKKSGLKQTEEAMNSLSNIATSIQKAYTAYNAISNGIRRNAENAEKKAQERQAQNAKEKSTVDKDKPTDGTSRKLSYRKENEAIASYLSSIGASDKTVSSIVSDRLENERLNNMTNYLNSLGISKDSANAITKAYTEYEKTNRGNS